MNALANFLMISKKSQTQIANDANCSRATICMIVNSVRRPSPDLALRISRATGGKVTVMELLYGKDTDCCAKDAA
jgi:plasmid maintenance system antidote protein VapI